MDENRLSGAARNVGGKIEEGMEAWQAMPKPKSKASSIRRQGLSRTYMARLQMPPLRLLPVSKSGFEPPSRRSPIPPPW